MQFRPAMILLAVLLAPVSLVMMFTPTVVSDMMGLPLESSLAALCSGQEVAKMEMVRVLGAWQLTLAIMVLVVRDLTDRHLQLRLIQAMLFTSVLHIGVNLHSLQIGNVSSYGWLPVVMSTVCLGVCLSVLWGRRGMTGV